MEWTTNKSQPHKVNSGEENSFAARAGIWTCNLSITSPVLLPANYPGIYTRGKAHMCSIPSLRSFPKCCLWSRSSAGLIALTMAISRPLVKEDFIKRLGSLTVLLSPKIVQLTGLSLFWGKSSSASSLNNFRSAEACLWDCFKARKKKKRKKKKKEKKAPTLTDSFFFFFFFFFLSRKALH